MNYGPHSNLVDEVFHFARSGPLLKPSGRVPQCVNIIRTSAEAKKHAWEKTCGEEELTWPDIRSRQMSAVWGIVYKVSDFGHINEKISSQMDEFSKNVKSQLGRLNAEYRELVDDVVADLWGCIYSRAVQERSNSFFEQLWEIYQCGGWPCGWDERYPQGQIMAFLPLIDETS